MQLRKIKDLKKLENNPRTIKKKDMDTLVKSIKENPDYFAARPLILSDRTGELIILGGNQRYEAAKIVGLEEVPTYLIEGLSEKREKEIIARDNISNGAWDWSTLANEWNAVELEEWGLELPKDFEEFEDDEEDAEEYSTKVDSPVYEPTNEKPEISELVENEKVNSLLSNIDNANVPEDIKLFLRVAAARHYKFNYSKIADYYAHSSGQIQSLMEESALVIIDFDKAIENGYVEMSQKLKDIYREEHEK